MKVEAGHWRGAIDEVWGKANNIFRGGTTADPSHDDDSMNDFANPFGMYD